MAALRGAGCYSRPTMTRSKSLLAAGVAGILVGALAPEAARLWDEHRLRQAQEQRRLYIVLKEREIACLDRLAAGGLAKGADVEAEIGRCRALAADPATGAPATDQP